MAFNYELNLRSPLTQRSYTELLDLVAAGGHTTVLDWGCGHGQNSDGLHQRGLQVSSFDYRPQRSEREADPESGVKPLPHYPHLEAYIERDDPVALPYDDGTFDAVLSMGVLEHVGDPDGSLEEIKRVLKPGGTLYVFKLPNRFSYTEKIGKHTGSYWHGHLPDDRLYTLRSARELVASHGFGITASWRANMVPLNRTGDRLPALARPLWTLNRVLERVPVLNLVSTNVELVAVAPRA
ncbi:methyltransferase domain-containing protein [Paraconexibacter sp.]|uniref:class I SAM-dependent methyltransferase n=1 Tax=Paraconexibacter sp. TaxID=2949640 RepID=UPI003561BD46